MRLLVGLEDPGGDEAAPAELALVGLLPRVRAHVLLQVAGLLEAFAAVVTPGHSRDQVSARRGHEGGAQAGGSKHFPQQLCTVRQSCQRQVCAPTVMHRQAELSERGVRTDSYTQSGRAVRQRCAYQQLCTVRQSCQREVCAPTVMHSEAELSERGVRTDSYTVRQSCQREEVCAPTVMHSEAELSERGGVCTNSYAQ